MAGARIEIPLNGAADWSGLVDIIQRMMAEFMAVSLTEMDTDAEPDVEGGSTVIVQGTCYAFAGDETPTGWAGIGNDTEAYLYVVPSGATCAVEWSDVAPTWNPAYQGYYDGNDRCIGGAFKDGAGDCLHKYLYTPDVVQQTIRDNNVRPILHRVIEIGSWNMDAVPTIDIYLGVAAAKIRAVDAVVWSDDLDYYRPLFVDIGQDVESTAGTWLYWITSAGEYYIRLSRGPDTNLFDHATWNDVAPTLPNRGYLYVSFEA